MKVIAIEKMFCVLLEPEDISSTPTVTQRPESITIIRVFDEQTRKTHYARYIGVNHAWDYLPCGSLYLGDTWDEAMKALGVLSP